MPEVEEFWEELLAQIEAGQVIPVVGPELLRVVLKNGEVASLYALIAMRLLRKYGLDTADVPLREHHELNDAVCALIHHGRRVQDLYRPVTEELAAVLQECSETLSPALRELAGIAGFRVFASTTPDSLLSHAIDEEVHEGSAKTAHIVFAPKLASGAIKDLPEPRSPQQTAVCYLFGKASPSPFVFAIHDEDRLEFMHNLQINGAEGMKRMFSELRTQNLLMIGCNFSDWLSRFFVRLTNVQRLAENRGKREFLIEQSSMASGSLTVFFERFSPNTWVFPGPAAQFVSELASRWRKEHPQSEPGEVAIPSSDSSRRTGEAFFISYSHRDAAAARQLFTDLQELGANIAWFDKDALEPGQDWGEQIRNAIKTCYWFLPLISANTEAIDESYFHEEWTQSTERARQIRGREFTIPVVIDRDYDGNAGRFTRIPSNFSQSQFGHAPEGRMSDDLRNLLVRLIRQRRGAE